MRPIIVAMLRTIFLCAVVSLSAMAAPGAAQSTASRPPQARPSAPPPASSSAQVPPAAPQVQPAPPPVPREEQAPDEVLLGFPIFPGARFLRSYDAGQGQRYYLFGSTASFAELVGYYRTVLKQKGELVFDQPPIHAFEVGRFREETMAFPPGVTVKDYTWGGSGGYLDPRPGANPQRYPTVIQFVALPMSDRR
jgi:hypothetical protein